MMHLPAEAASQLSAVCDVLRSRLADQLLAVHLYGSAVDGGLKPSSDLDLMVSVAQPLTESARNELMHELLHHSAPPGSSTLLRALEVTVVAIGEVVPWRYPPRREMQFGEWLREDILNGRIEPEMLDVDLAILLTKARKHSTALVGPSAAELFDSVPAADLRRAMLDTCKQWNTGEDWEGDEITVLLALARIWFTACTGKIASKDAAASWAMERLPDAHRQVMSHALHAYLRGTGDASVLNPAELAETIHFCKQEIALELKQRAET